jgi:carbonyl reductase 1
MAGSLGKFSSDLAGRFRGASSVDQINQLMTEFATDVSAGNESSKGWPSAAYAASKAGATGMTIVIGRQEKQKGSKVLINACCPGWVMTDMTKGKGYKTPDQGKQHILSYKVNEILMSSQALKLQ